MSHDVEDIKDVVALACELCDCAVLVAADGHLGFEDIGQLWAIVERIGPAFTGIDELPQELSDLTAAECDEIIGFIDSELDAATGKSRIILDKVLQAVKACYEVYLAVKGAQC